MKKQFINVIKSYLWPVITVLAALILILTAGFYYSNQAIREQVRQVGEGTMNTIEAKVTASLKMAEYQFDVIYEEFERMVHSGTDRDSILAFMLTVRDKYDRENSRMPEFMSTYGFFDHELIFDDEWDPGEDYIVGERPWYAGAIHDRGRTHFSEPYIDAQTQKMCISFSRRLEDLNGDFYGVFAMDLEISRITDYIEALRLDNHGYGVFISDNLLIKSHRDKHLINVALRDAGGGYARLADLMEEGQPISVERFTDADGTDSIAFFRTIFSGWHIGVIVPGNIYYNQIYHLMTITGILVLILIAALFFILNGIVRDKIRSDDESRIKSRFVEQISHEMRTPLNTIVTMSEIAKKAESNKLTYCLDRISAASNHLLGVVTEVLDMSKIEAGEVELNISDFVVAEMLNRPVTIFSYDMAQKHQELSIHIGEKVPEAIVSDRQLLTQVLVNLLSNAYRYTPSGGWIGISVESAGHKGDEHTLRFSVADNGIGIADERKSELFEYSSTGLGLSVSQHIVKRLGGEIWVESKPGEGTRFIFDIKVKAGKAVWGDIHRNPDDEKVKDTLKITKFPGKHILLVEDKEIFRNIVTDLIIDTEVLIDYAEDGREAVAKFAAAPDKYDLIFMDIMMPEMDGYKATAKIREMDAVQARNVPIIAMTANVFKEDAEHCINAGMNGHIGKPVFRRDILMAMQEFIVMGNDEAVN